MPEQIWILLLFLVVVLFNLITGFLARRRERGATSEAKEAAQPAPRASPAVPPRAVRTPPGVGMTPARVDMSLPTPQRRRRAKLGRDEVRRAIVVMTFVGPPRGLVDVLDRRE